ncbi:CLUMA_CG021584, isoform A [Clunio marinus]|uniref:CLUMA_CG021584, isoform A n=1 Tax=Clunio marinus TaxID=568069 RepID=A0A1J1JAN3_9DIPT|nr:CLUMA_CG021584, isoform A [Clunio marinus]
MLDISGAREKHGLLICRQICCRFDVMFTNLTYITDQQQRRQASSNIKYKKPDIQSSSVKVTIKLAHRALKFFIQAAADLNSFTSIPVFMLLSCGLRSTLGNRQTVPNHQTYPKASTKAHGYSSSI